jgi:hypothetical protein
MTMENETHEVPGCQREAQVLVSKALKIATRLMDCHLITLSQLEL